MSLVQRLRDEHAELANPREDWTFLLEAADRIEELQRKLELWNEYYVHGMHPDDVQTLSVDTLYLLEDDK